MKYNGKTCNGLGEFIAERKKDWMADKSRSMEDNVKYWEDEGIVWAVQEYYGSMGEFTDADIEVIEHCFGQYASDIIDICEGD